MRDTDYARELATFAIGDNRIERLYVKEEEQEEIRFSWWPGGNMANRPLDVSEEQLIALIAGGILHGVISAGFLPRLIVAAGSAANE